MVDLGSRNLIADEEKDFSNISTKATLLLGELLFLTNTILPSSQCARVQVKNTKTILSYFFFFLSCNFFFKALPVLLKYAASQKLGPILRSRSSAMITNLHQYHHLKHTISFYDFHLSLIVLGANKHKQMKGRDRRLDRIRDVKMKLDYDMDVEQLKNRIQESNVSEWKIFQIFWVNFSRHRSIRSKIIKAGNGMLFQIFWIDHLIILL